MKSNLMRILSYNLAGNAVAAWIMALIIFLGVLAGLMFLKKQGVRQLKKLADCSPYARHLSFIAELIGKTNVSFIFFMAALGAVNFLELPRNISRLPAILLKIALLVQGTIWISSFINLWLKDYKERRLESDPSSVTTITALGVIAKLFLYISLALLLLANLDVDITPLVASFGIAGIAVGLAAQKILGDLFASLSIVLDKPFIIGDFIIVGEFLGTVEHIGLKTTRLRSLGGEQLVLSNSDLLASRIRNYKRMYERRVVFSFGVVYQTPLEKLRAIPEEVRRIIESVGQTRYDRAHFKSYGDSALVFEVVYYILSPEYNTYMDIQQAINLSLYEKFQTEGINFAYPTQTIYIEGDITPIGAAALSSAARH